MKIIKPQKVGLLTHTFENEGRSYFVLTAMAFYPFGACGKLLHEVAMWKMAVDQLGPNVPLDTGMTKARAEVLVAGKAFAPNGGETTARAVRLTVKRQGRALVDKELYVIGDRRWEFSGPSSPLPFSEMPVTWERAFGGPGCELNPIGKGAAPVEIDGVRVHPLPNIENPKDLVKSKGDRPFPVGLGPIDQTWPQRFVKAGTYDSRWLEERFPGFAADLDWTYFNTAPEDQQIDGYFSGGETFEVHGMHREKAVVETGLPPFRARLFVVQSTPGGEVMREAVPRIDTVYLFPNVERAVVIYRGALEIEEDDGADVLHVVAAFEEPEQARSLEHYRQVVAKRQDKKLGAVYALMDEDLLPKAAVSEGEGGASVPEDDWNDMAEVVKTEGLIQKRLEKQIDAQVAVGREMVVAAGLDPAEYDRRVAEGLAKREEKPKGLADVPALFERADADAAAAQKAADDARKELEAFAREQMKAMGLDYDAVVAKSKQEGGGPPKFSAKAQIEWLEEMVQLGRNGGVPMKDAEAKLADPKFFESLYETERNLLEAYRRFGHFCPAARRLDEGASAEVRRAVVEARGRGESLAGRDLTGADLSGLDLSGVDLSGALLEAASLRGARLDGANLRQAMLARADLEGASLEGASVVQANFGEAILRGARFGDGADLSGVTFFKTDLRGAVLRGAKLSAAQIFELDLEGADLCGAALDGALFMETKAPAADFSGAMLKDAMFVKAVVAGAKFVGADLTDATFVETVGDGAVFVTAVLRGARMVLKSSFADADFKGARLLRTCLRTTVLRGADFSGAEIPEVDFSECDMTGAKLYRAKGDGCLFVRANLEGADLRSATLKSSVLQKARLASADLRGANLFRSDMAKIESDGRTNLEGALLTEIRVVPKRPKGSASAGGPASEKPRKEGA